MQTVTSLTTIKQIWILFVLTTITTEKDNDNIQAEQAPQPDTTDLPNSTKLVLSDHHAGADIDIPTDAGRPKCKQTFKSTICPVVRSLLR